MKRRPCWCPKPIPWKLNSFLMQKLSFVPINLHRRWPCEWKHSIFSVNVICKVTKTKKSISQWTNCPFYVDKDKYWLALDLAPTPKPYPIGVCSHTRRWFRRDFYNGAKQQRADLTLQWSVNRYSDSSGSKWVEARNERPTKKEVNIQRWASREDVVNDLFQFCARLLLILYAPDIFSCRHEQLSRMV